MFCRISALYYARLFLAQYYKWRIWFLSSCAIFLSINCNLTHSSYSISLFYWILVSFMVYLPIFSSSIIQLTSLLLNWDKLEKNIWEDGKEIPTTDRTDRKKNCWVMEKMFILLLNNFENNLSESCHNTFSLAVLLCIYRGLPYWLIITLQCIYNIDFSWHEIKILMQVLYSAFIAGSTSWRCWN